MTIQIVVGTVVSMISIMIHALTTVGAIGIARSAGLRNSSWPKLHLMAVMAATASVLLAAHMFEVFVWSLAYWWLEVAPKDADLAYFAFVNYTTLGYGDVTPVKEWRLLGPMTAMNGVLMFGWSTAVLFEVLLKAIERYWSAPSP
jgi:Ion channel